MGLNFHVRCTRHRVVACIARGQESEALHAFYKEHTECRQRDPESVEVRADEESESYWMSEPPPVGYTNLGLLPSSVLGPRPH